MPPHRPKLFGSHAGYLLELRREVCQRAISERVSNLVCGKLTVAEQLLGVFYAMNDGKPLNGHATHLGEEFAQGAIVFIELVR